MSLLPSGIKKLFLKGRPGLINDFTLVSLLFTAALAVRVPWLWEVPRYIDELKEVNLAYQIYLGREYPLHNMAHEIGALHNYILAGIFQLLGPGIYWPRLYVAVTSAATVPLIYFLGKRLYNRRTGLIAAGLLLANGMHILVTHMAWSNCTTPFFFSLALLTLRLAEERKSGKWLIVSGALWALTLQTHSSVILYLPVAGLYVVNRRFRSRTGISPGCYIWALIAFVTGYANMIYYNISSGLGSVGWIFGKDYTLEASPGLYSFGLNFYAMFTELIRSISATYRACDSFGGYLRQPLFLGCMIIFGLGVFQTVQKRQWLPVWLIIAGFLVIPWANRRYGFFIVTRYIMPVVICSILLLAYGISVIFEYVALKTGRKRVTVALLFSLVIIFGAIQLGIFYNYCRSMAGTDMSNRPALRLIHTVEQWDYNKKALVLVDDRVRLRNDPLPILLSLSPHHFRFKRVGFWDSPHLTETGKWIQHMKKYHQRRVLVIMSPVTFQFLRPKFTIHKLKAISFQPLLNRVNTSPPPGRIYIAEL